jgi:hypothetical protein
MWVEEALDDEGKWQRVGVVTKPPMNEGDTLHIP